MDDLVLAALKKWPNVPDCYGWLGLDARGDWYMRDDRVQAVGAFQSDLPGAKGARLTHEKLVAFIGRNYSADAAGQWFFQNGPQRVYVELMHAPWVWRMHADGSLRTHTGEPSHVDKSFADEQGYLYLSSPLGLGLLHTQDMHIAADKIEQGEWLPQTVSAAQLASEYGFVRSPANSSRQSRPVR